MGIGKNTKNVIIVLKLHGERGKQFLMDEVSKYSKKLRIKVIDSTLSVEQMIALRELTDVYLSLHRSEGFGLNIAENMLAGNLVIATGYSGNMDFMTAENSYLVDYTIVPLEEGNYPYWVGQWWAEPSVDSAVWALREAYEDKNKASQLAKNAKDSISFQLSGDAVCNVFYEQIGQLN